MSPAVSSGLRYTMTFPYACYFEGSLYNSHIDWDDRDVDAATQLSMDLIRMVN